CFRADWFEQLPSKLDEFRGHRRAICDSGGAAPSGRRPQPVADSRNTAHTTVRYVGSSILNNEALPQGDHDRPEPPPPAPPRRIWKRLAIWIAAILLGLTAVIFIGVVALVHNSAFRQYLLRIAHAKLVETVGLDVRVRDFSLRWSGWAPSIDMYDVVIEGGAPYQNSPLLETNHLSVGIQIISLLQRKWYLKEIVIDRLVAHVSVGEDGETNVPMLKFGVRKNVFDFGVRHFSLGQGEIYYNDKKSALNAELHDLEFQATFDPGMK